LAQVAEVKEQAPKKPRKTMSAIVATFVLPQGSIPTFRELFKVLKDALADEIPLMIHEDKLEIRVMDPSRVKMAHFVFPKQIFEEWHVLPSPRWKSAPLPIIIKLRVEDLIYAIEDAGKDAKARFEVAAIFTITRRKVKAPVHHPADCPKCKQPTTLNQLPRDKQKIVQRKRSTKQWYKCPCGWRGKLITMQRSETVLSREVTKDSAIIVEVVERTKDKYRLDILDEEVEEEPLPKLTFNARFKVMGKEFKAKLDKLRKKADVVKIVGSDTGLNLSGRGDYISGDINIEKGSDILLVAEAHQPQKDTLSLDHLISIFPKTNVADVIALEYTTDMPIRVTWLTSLGEATIEFFMAPRIEVE